MRGDTKSCFQDYASRLLNESGGSVSSLDKISLISSAPQPIRPADGLRENRCPTVWRS